ncbi:hypothetical protein, partial [Agathobaculum sp.]|uniref:hypothetical protein n=1 Tax=Agathobaculum sp. TaxID=2048138 RepID=UPI0027B8EFB9
AIRCLKIRSKKYAADCNRTSQHIRKNRWNFSIGFFLVQGSGEGERQQNKDWLKRGSGLSRDRKLCLIY